MRQLKEAQLHLAKRPFTLEDLISARELVIGVAVQTRTTVQRNDDAFAIRIAAAVYGLGIATFIVCLLIYRYFNEGSLHDAGLKRPFIGIPAYVWIWSAIGSVTAMLLRAGEFTRRKRFTAARWLLYRPIAGISTGVLLYLILKAGFLVLSNDPSPNEPNPELLYVLSYLGGFSDTLAVNMSQRIMGHIGEREQQDVGIRVRDNAQAGDTVSA